MTDPRQPATAPGTDPAGTEFTTVQQVARALGLGTEQQRF